MKVCNDLVKKIIAEEVESLLNEEQKASNPRLHIDGFEDGWDNKSLGEFMSNSEVLISLAYDNGAPGKAFEELYEVIINLSNLIIQNPPGNSVADKLTLSASVAAAWSHHMKGKNERLQVALRALYKRSTVIAKELEIAEKAGLQARGEEPNWQAPGEERAQPPTQGRTHKVVEGETLWGLSRKFLGDPRRWMEIWNATPALKNNKRMYRGGKPNPRILQIGTVLTIPAK